MVNIFLSIKREYSIYLYVCFLCAVVIRFMARSPTVSALRTRRRPDRGRERPKP